MGLFFGRKKKRIEELEAEVSRLNREIINIEEDVKKMVSILEQKHQSELNKVNMEFERKMLGKEAVIDNIRLQLSKEREAFAQKTSALEEQHKQDLVRAKELSQEAIMRAKTYIETKRDILKDLSEKELLVEIMIALGGYGTRLESLEKVFSVDSVLEKIHNLTESTHGKLDSMIRDINVRINEIRDSINQNMSVMTESISDKMEVIEETIDESLSNYDFNALSSNVSDIKSAIENMTNEYEYGTLASKLCYVESTVGNIESTVDNIESKVNSVESDVSAIRSDVYDLSGIRDAVERVESEVSYARSDISSIESVVNNRY